MFKHAGPKSNMYSHEWEARKYWIFLRKNAHNNFILPKKDHIALWLGVCWRVINKAVCNALAPAWESLKAFSIKCNKGVHVYHVQLKRFSNISHRDTCLSVRPCGEERELNFNVKIVGDSPSFSFSKTAVKFWNWWLVVA